MKEFVIIPGTDCQEHYLVRLADAEVAEVSRYFESLIDWEVMRRCRDHRWLAPTKPDTGFVSLLYVGVACHPQEQYNLLKQALCNYYEC